MSGGHSPYSDDGVIYCGWDGHDGCGELWPCSAVRADLDACSHAATVEQGDRLNCADCGKYLGEPAPIVPQPANLLDELRSLLNRTSREANSGTPDYLLAEFLLGSLELFERVTVSRDAWWGNTAQIARQPVTAVEDVD